MVGDFETESDNHSFICGPGYITSNCSMSKQALGLYHSKYLSRFDGNVKTLASPTRAIFEPQLAGMIGFNDLPAGEMVIMAFKTYTGYTQEDAFVFNRSSVQRGLFQMIKWSVYKTEIKSTSNYTERLGRPKPKKDEPADRYVHIGDDGLPIVGASVSSGSCVIGKIRRHQSGTEENASEFMGIGEEGYVDNVFVDKNASTGLHMVKVRIRDSRFPVVGDKFAPRYAQKGTIGLMLGQENMPFVGDVPAYAEITKDQLINQIIQIEGPFEEESRKQRWKELDKMKTSELRDFLLEQGVDLPAPAKKRYQEAPTLDIIVNPHALPSRMTFSYFMEIMASKMGALRGERINATAFRPFKEANINISLRDYGFHPQGYVQMTSGFTGKLEETLTFAGPCYFQALRHHVKDKYNMRQCGSKKAATRVPIGGRKIRGGIRLTVACVEYKLFRVKARQVRDVAGNITKVRESPGISHPK